MAKRTKSAETTANTVKWEQTLVTSPFEEETWSPCVAWVVGRQTDDFKHIDALNIIIQTGIRKLFSVITKEQLYLDVRDFGNPKNKKVREVPPLSEVCEACKVHLDAGEAIPTLLLAKLIKWKLLGCKDAHLKKQGIDTKKNPEETPNDKRKTKDQKEANKERVKSPKKGGKKSPEAQAVKEGSKLKKRGEDEEETKYIDDEPEDGAQHYFILTGFHDPYLFLALESMLVKINCVIAISTQDDLRGSSAEEDKTTVLEDSNKEELRGELRSFWRDLLLLLQGAPDGSSLQDIARLDYEVLQNIIPPSNPQDTEQRVQYCSKLFDDIAHMLYSLTDSKRLYKTYLANLRLDHVPLLRERSESSLDNTPGLEVTSELVDLRYYRDLMSTIPLESDSVTLIMHCMLEQVVASEEGKVPPSEEPPPVREDGLNFELSSYLGEMASKLGLTREEHEALSKVLTMPQPMIRKNNIPELIHVYDKIYQRTGHLKPYYGFDAASVERHMQQFLPVIKLCQVQQPPPAELSLRAVRLQELFFFCSYAGFTLAEVDHAFKQFVLEQLNLTKCDRNGYPLQIAKEGLHQHIIPWDDPYPFYKIMVPPSDNTPEEDDFSSPIPPLGDIKEAKTDSTVPSLLRDQPIYKSQVSKLNSAQRMSDVIMEMAVTLDKGSCLSKSDLKKSEEKLVTDLVASLTPTDVKLGHPTYSRTSSLISPRHSVSTSVRFDVPQNAEIATTISDFMVCSKSLEDTLSEITVPPERNLDNWCITEHFKPHILYQVLEEALYHLPFVETYHHKRDNSVMLVLHNPFNKDRQNIINWNVELHSNTGFRNYMEYTVESIQVWLKKKDAEYQAQLLSKEVANIVKEEAERAKSLEKLDKKSARAQQKSAKSKSPKGSASASQEKLETVSASTNPYVRPGSLKALQMEQMRLAQEEEEKARIRLERVSKSAHKLKEKQKAELSEKTKLETKASKEDIETAPSVHSQSQVGRHSESVLAHEEPLWEFSGYDTGNKLIHYHGFTSSMFPIDGGSIRTERMERVQGNTSVKSVVQKDGHVFVVHVINPRDDMNLPEGYAEELTAANSGSKEQTQSPRQTPEIVESRRNSHNMSAKLRRGSSSRGNEETKDSNKGPSCPASQFGSIIAHLSDGMVLSLSQFGSTGQSYLQPYQPARHMPSFTGETHSSTNITNVGAPVSKSKTNLGKNKTRETNSGDKNKNMSSEEQPTKEVAGAITDEVNRSKFQELSVSCPDGLTLKYFCHSNDNPSKMANHNWLLVRQSYPCRTKGVQSCESARHKYAATERSRIITADGAVIKHMVDGRFEVLSADGSISTLTKEAPDGNFEDDAKVRKTSKKSGKSMSTSYWMIVYPGGEQVCVSSDTGDYRELLPLKTSVAHDPKTKQVMTTREDHVIIINYPDGRSVVEHADGTRISTYFRDIYMEETEEDIEATTHTKFSPQTTLITTRFIKVECPGFATVDFNTDTSENLTSFGNGTNINAFPDGYYMLHRKDGGKIEIDTDGALTYFPMPNNLLKHIMPEYELEYILRHNADIIVETIDPIGNVFNVRNNGESIALPASGEETVSSKNQESENAASTDLHAPRYFTIKADGSGTELLRYQDVASYLVKADKNPDTAVLKESVPGHFNMTAMTILKPFKNGLSEKWLKKYDQDVIIPAGLRCRDLKTLPAVEQKKPGPPFGTNVGRGLNIGNLPKAPPKHSIPKCPEKLQYRQFLQYKPISENQKKKLRSALRDYAREVVSRMQAESLMLIEETRPEKEVNMAEALKTMAEAEKLQAQKLEPGQVKEVYEQAVNKAPPCPPPKPPPKLPAAYWEQKNKEREEEMEAKRIIRNRIIEPYFKSELGKAYTYTLSKLLTSEKLEQHQAQKLIQMIYRGIQEKNQHDVVASISDASNSRNLDACSFRAAVASDLREEMKHVLEQHKKAPHQSTSADWINANKHRMSSLKDTGAAVNSIDSNEKLRHLLKGTRSSHGSHHRYSHAFSSISISHRSGSSDSSGKSFTDFVAKWKEFSRDEDDDGFAQQKRVGFQPQDQRPTQKLPQPEQIKRFASRLQERLHKSSIVTPVSRWANIQRDVSQIPTLSGKKKNAANMYTAGSRGVVRSPLHSEKTSQLYKVAQKILAILKQTEVSLISNPEWVNCGTLQEGQVYPFTILLRNTGVDSIAYNARAPKPSTGLRILKQSGSIPPGLSDEMHLELKARTSAVEKKAELGNFSHTLDILTGRGSLKIPVLATILSVEDYNNPDVLPTIKRSKHNSDLNGVIESKMGNLTED